MQRGDPVVVRRAITPVDQVAVGVRGQLRYQRYAAQMPRSLISRQLKPEALTREIRNSLSTWQNVYRAFPAL